MIARAMRVGRIGNGYSRRTDAMATSVEKRPSVV